MVESVDDEKIANHLDRVVGNLGRKPLKVLVQVNTSVEEYGEPLNFCEATKDSRRKQATDEQIKTIEKNNTWVLTTLPKDHEAIGVKWVCNTKKNADGEVERYKARIVAKGYKQKHGVDYEEV